MEFVDIRIMISTCYNSNYSHIPTGCSYDWFVKQFWLMQEDLKTQQEYSIRYNSDLCIYFTPKRLDLNGQSDVYIHSCVQKCQVKQASIHVHLDNHENVLYKGLCQNKAFNIVNGCIQGIETDDNKGSDTELNINVLEDQSQTCNQNQNKECKIGWSEENEEKEAQIQEFTYKIEKKASFSNAYNRVISIDDFRELGVGGLTTEIKYIIENIFLPKLDTRLGKILEKQYGLLIYGPPGTGKTLISDAIFKIWQKFINPQAIQHLVRGPELFSELLGKTEENVRELFQPALDDQEAYRQGKRLKLIDHIYLIDEIDAMFSVRSSGQGEATGATNRAVGQFLSIIGGSSKPDNIFIIATTNRKELVDPAVIRPGRIGYHLEFKSLEIEDRSNIFEKYINDLKQLKLLNNEKIRQNIIKEFCNIKLELTGAQIAQLTNRMLVKMVSDNSDFVELQHFKQAIDDLEKEIGQKNDVLKNLVHYYESGKSLSNDKSLIQKRLSEPGFNQDIDQMRKLLISTVDTKRTVVFVNDDQFKRNSYLLEIVQTVEQNFRQIVYISMIKLLQLPNEQKVKQILDEIREVDFFKEGDKLIIIDELDSVINAKSTKQTIIFTNLLKNLSHDIGQIKLGFKAPLQKTSICLFVPVQRSTWQIMQQEEIDRVSTCCQFN